MVDDDSEMTNAVTTFQTTLLSYLFLSLVYRNKVIAKMWYACMWLLDN